ncbi:MAG: hypothetical protein UV73_C0002G0160 [Candidatus Gottesmanbacteria bacterium GW2011_GWA2_43_14]|uniref:O-antigen ligase-related domain-containing protein n=1 Tax=Candidatus Gottesmanbacteria bacterium GW2011_GWA2_43_14 TaxID=1618443 RepID=A0A0G1FTW2_9BACT|nr:MAG: hypothetical protein UV73_C0002G0160 [Candidatus Gottesmanbacteria bacterium GW2011_GWA2_43_14]
MKKEKILLLTLLLVYVLLVMSPTRWLFPFAWLVLFSVFSRFFKTDLPESLYLLTVFSLPFTFGKTLFSQPEYPLIATPFLLLVSASTLLSLRRLFFLKTDFIRLLPLFFLMLAAVSLLTSIHPAVSVVGLAELTSFVFFYYLSLLYLKDKTVFMLSATLLLSFLCFESLLIISQSIAGRPLGLLIEQGLLKFPWGRIEGESKLLFRPSGTFAEPTFASRLMTLLLPLTLVLPAKLLPFLKKFRLPLLIAGVVAILLTLTRVSMLTAAILVCLTLYWRRKKLPKFRFRFQKLFPAVLATGLLFYFLLPPLFQRLKNTPLSFGESGSMSVRLKLLQETTKILPYRPLTGVGLNSFVPAAGLLVSENFDEEDLQPVHNVPLLIAVETGLPASFLFLIFLLWQFRRSYGSHHQLALLGVSAYLLETSMGTNFLSPHLALLFYYAALNS